MHTFRLSHYGALLATLSALAARTATSSPLTTHLLEPRIPRCDFPGELYNACVSTSLTFKYDTGSIGSNSSGTPPQPNFQIVSLAPGENSLAYTCDADFIEVQGYTLVVDATDVGPYKGRSEEERTVRNGGEWKMDAYTLTCSEDSGNGGAGISGASEGCADEKVVRCAVKDNGNQF